jgi:hypothetical protein
MPPQPPVESPRPTLLHVEFRLDWPIALSQLENATPDRRLNAIENLVTALSRSWRRADHAIKPARDLRLSRATYKALAAWVELREPAVGGARVRLADYASGCVVDDRLVTEGWLKLIIE